jgi:uncharacterized protein involved in exopolysaccharide biosynthesis
MSQFSDQEIDLRPYISAVIDNWYWILGFGLLAAMLGYGASFLTAPTYEATALIAISEPRQRVQFDPRIVTVADNQPLKAYPELAKSDELLESLRQQIEVSSPMSLDALRGILSAGAGSDPSLLRLTARHENPEDAAEIANTWASLFVSWANQIYSGQSEEQFQFFAKQLTEATRDLEQTQQDLIDFQTKNQSAILRNELEALQQLQADYLAQNRQIRLLLQEIEAIESLRGDGSTLNEELYADQLAATLLQIRAFGGVPNNIESVNPLNIQVTIDQSQNATPAEQAAIINNLKATLSTQATLIDTSLEDLEPQILAIQQAKQKADSEETRLLLREEVSEGTYTALALKVEEERITSRDSGDGLTLASQAATPSSPSGTSKTLLAVVAGFLGIALGIVFVVLFTWWRNQIGVQENEHAQPE